MNRIEEWAKLIQTYEGYSLPSYKNLWRGSLTYRLKNPGALRYSPYQSGTKNGFACFDTYEIGFKALVYQLTIACKGISKVYKPTDTLLDFQKKYSPASDSNLPIKYANFVAKGLNVSPLIQIKNLLS